MLVRDPRKRPDAQSILKHEWLRGGGAAAPEAPMQPEILNRMKRFAGMNRFKKEALRVRQGSRGGLSQGWARHVCCTPPCVLSLSCIRLLPHTCRLRRLRASARCSWTWTLTAAAPSPLKS